MGMGKVHCQLCETDVALHSRVGLDRVRGHKRFARQERHTMKTLCSTGSATSFPSPPSGPSGFSPSPNALVSTREVIKSMADRTLLSSAAPYLTSPTLDARSDSINCRISSSRLSMDQDMSEVGKRTDSHQSIAFTTRQMSQCQCQADAGYYRYTNVRECMYL